MCKCCWASCLKITLLVNTANQRPPCKRRKKKNFSSWWCPKFCCIADLQLPAVSDTCKNVDCLVHCHMLWFILPSVSLLNIVGAQGIGGRNQSTWQRTRFSTHPKEWDTSSVQKSALQQRLWTLPAENIFSSFTGRTSLFCYTQQCGHFKVVFPLSKMFLVAHNNGVPTRASFLLCGTYFCSPSTVMKAGAEPFFYSPLNWNNWIC